MIGINNPIPGAPKAKELRIARIKPIAKPQIILLFIPIIVYDNNTAVNVIF